MSFKVRVWLCPIVLEDCWVGPHQKGFKQIWIINKSQFVPTVYNLFAVLWIPIQRTVRKNTKDWKTSQKRAISTSLIMPTQGDTVTTFLLDFYGQVTIMRNTWIAIAPFRTEKWGDLFLSNRVELFHSDIAAWLALSTLEISAEHLPEGHKQRDGAKCQLWENGEWTEGLGWFHSEL